MQFSRPSRALYVCALFTALMFSTVAASKSNGREFSGFFDLSGVQEQGDLVQVTLHLQLLNSGATDVKGAIVTLFDSTPGMNLQGNFAPVKLWKQHQSINLSKKFTITKQEFANWGIGQPNLVILTQDAKGRTIQRGAQVSRWPLVLVKE